MGELCACASTGRHTPLPATLPGTDWFAKKKVRRRPYITGAVHNSPFDARLTPNRSLSRYWCVVPGMSFVVACSGEKSGFPILFEALLENL